MIGRIDGGKKKGGGGVREKGRKLKRTAIDYLARYEDDSISITDVIGGTNSIDLARNFCVFLFSSMFPPPYQFSSDASVQFTANFLFSFPSILFYFLKFPLGIKLSLKYLETNFSLSSPPPTAFFTLSISSLN